MASVSKRTCSRIRWRTLTELCARRFDLGNYSTETQIYFSGGLVEFNSLFAEVNGFSDLLLSASLPFISVLEEKVCYRRFQKLDLNLSETE